MSFKLKTNAAYLKLLFTAELKQKKVLILTGTESQLRSLFEICVNVLFGGIHLTTQHLNKLKLYKKSIRLLADRSVSTQKKQKLLIKHLNIIPLLLKPIISQISNHV